ncbi:MAG: TlpA family protein disulfide reductase [Phycisphaerales bacterium]|nr:TlpA family protein disulfide reductase [Phycisphaerales bacterium]
MKYTTSLIAALSGLALISGLPAPVQASQGPGDKAAAHEKKTLEDLMPDLKKPELWIGSSAPELSIAKFVKGDSVDQFEEGQVYVVEFWATWCGPCIRAFPHLTELQESYGEDVRFIGVNIWEREKGQERMDMVEEFVEKQGERMGYTVAVEDGTSMADNWMKPAGQGGIPAAFIVGKDTKIAWVGHPGEMDAPLEQIVNGDFDSKTAAKDAWDDQVLSAAYRKFAMAFQRGDDLNTGRKIGEILMNDHFSDEPGGLNALAWMMLNSEAEGVGSKDHQAALRAAAKACELTDWEDWGILDTYALAMYKTGDRVSAIKWEKKAIELAKQDTENGGVDAVPELEEQLARFESDD